MGKASAVKLKDLIPDDKNFNKGSEFGNSLIEKSFRKFGAGRSILLDKNNRIIAGNKSVENAAAIGMDDVQIVESDGKRIIAVKRTDIDLDSPEGREMALADNASAKANIVFDAELVEAELGEAVCTEWGIESNVKLEAVEDDFNGVPPKEPITVLGDLYELNEHRLHCADSCDSDAVANGRGKYQNKYEPIWFGWVDNGTSFYGDRTQTNVWDIPRPKKSEEHPTMKPVELVSKAINHASRKDDTILDLFYGSGTTLIASDQLNRICYGQELDPKYCDVIVARYIKHRKETGSSLVIKRNGQQLSEDEINKYIENTNAEA